MAHTPSLWKHYFVQDEIPLLVPVYFNSVPDEVYMSSADNLEMFAPKVTWEIDHLASKVIPVDDTHYSFTELGYSTLYDFTLSSQVRETVQHYKELDLPQDAVFVHALDATKCDIVEGYESKAFIISEKDLWE